MRKKYYLLTLIMALACASSAVADEVTRAVQEELRHRHLFYGDVNGRESPELTAALKHYQERKGFRQTGEADAETLRSMNISEPTEKQNLPDVPVLRSDGGRPLADPHRGEDTAEATRPLAMNTVLPSATEMTLYLRQYLDACQGPDLPSELTYYAPQVAYFDHGVVTKTYIRNELLGYRQHWPERRYELVDKVSVGSSAGKVMLQFGLRFALVNAGLNRTAAGLTKNVVLLSRGSNENWEISSIKEERVRPVVAHRKKSSTRGRTSSKSSDAMARTMNKVRRTVRKLFK